MNAFHIAQRAHVPPFHVMDVLAACAQREATHGDLVNLVAGQPSTGAPLGVRREAQRLLGTDDPMGYTVATGILPLRQAIADHYARREGVAISPDDIVVTTGSSGGFALTFLAAFEPGDRVAIARPGYPCYRNVLTSLGCEVVEFDCGPETRFQPTVAHLEALGPIQGLIVASPANPTGTMLLPEELAAIAQWCEANTVQLISDEIYHGIEYAPLGVDTPNQRGALSRSAWLTSREAIVFGSFSKYFCMTGWRIGWMLVPERMRRTIDILAGNFSICPPALAQYAALAAFSDESYAELDGHVARYATNRQLLLDALPAMGISRLAPADGAFYVYADIRHLADDSLAWTRELLNATGVGLVPGVDFDTRDGQHFVRFSFAHATESVEEGVRRLGAYLVGA